MVSPLSAGLDMSSRLEFIQRGFDENTSHGNNDTTTGFVGKFTLPKDVFLHYFQVSHRCRFATISCGIGLWHVPSRLALHRAGCIDLLSRYVGGSESA